MFKSFEKVKDSFKNLNDISAAVLYHGLKLALGVLVLSIFLFLINSNYFSSNYSNSLIIQQIVTTSITVFTEIVVGSLIIDIITKRSAA